MKPACDLLLPEQVFSAVDEGELRHRAAALDLAVDLSAPETTALLRSLLFERWPELLPRHVELTEAHRFYNRFFWFVRFATQRQAVHGFDAGLEQQIFQLVESEIDGLDVAVVKDIECRARS